MAAFLCRLWTCGLCGGDVPAYRRRCPCQSPLAPSTTETGRTPR